MHKPAAGDLDAHLGRALDEAPSLAGRGRRVRGGARREGASTTRAARWTSSRAAVGAPISPSGRARRPTAGSPTWTTGSRADAYWRAPTWKRIAVIVAGPSRTSSSWSSLLAVVFMLGVPIGASTVGGQVNAGSPAAGDRDAGQVTRSSPSTGSAVDVSPTSSRAIRDSGGQPIAITVMRDGAQVDLDPGAPTARRRATGSASSSGRRGELRPGRRRSQRVRGDWAVTEEIGQSLGRLVTGGAATTSRARSGSSRARARRLEVGLPLLPRSWP